MLSQSWPFSNIQAERTGAGGAAGASVGAAGTGWKPGYSKQTISIFDSNQIKLVHLISGKCHQEPESLSVIAKALLVYPKYIWEPEAILKF